LDELVAALSSATAYPSEAAGVEVRQTHISVLFFVDGLVYKVKKPVGFGFLDFTTLARRRHFCEEEVRLNEKLAPGVYRGVVRIVRTEQGRLRVDGDGEPVEFAVEMRRLPPGRMMDVLLEAGEIDNQQMDELARLLVAFHGDAASGPGVEEHGSPEAVTRNVVENFDQTRGFVAPVGSGAQAGARTASPALHGHLEAASRAFLAQEAPLLARRVAEGRIREGHGDLHAENICMTGGEILVYDRIEFAACLRCGDVACDLAFLAMDLDHRCFRGFSRYLVRRYAALSGDADLATLVDFYKVYRALVRAKVLSLTAVDQALAPGHREQARRAAMSYWQLAASYVVPAAVVLTCGLPATGKTTAARHVARPFEAPVLRSDVRRKLLAGVPPSRARPEAFGTGLYGAEMTDRTYDALLSEARELLRAGRTVVVDATFSSADRRRPFARLAGELGLPLVLVEATAPEQVVRARLAERAAAGGDASDADLSVYLRLRESFEAPRELPPSSVVAASPGVEAEVLSERVIEAIIDQV
ncbi:MAG: AAA family ATPase, partial [Gaiellales bacterium]